MRQKLILLTLLLLLAACARPSDITPEASATPASRPQESAASVPALVTANTPPPLPAMPDPIETPLPEPADAAARERWLERVKAFGLDKLDYTVNDNPILMRADMVMGGVMYGDTINAVNAVFGEPIISVNEFWDGTCDWHWRMTYDNGIIAKFISFDENEGYTLDSIQCNSEGIEGPRGIRIGDPVQKVIDTFRVEERISYPSLYDGFLNSYLKDNDDIVVLFAESEYSIYETDDYYFDFFGRMPPFGIVNLYDSDEYKEYSIWFAAPYDYETSTDFYAELQKEYKSMYEQFNYDFITEMLLRFDICYSRVVRISWHVGAWGE